MSPLEIKPLRILDFDIEARPLSYLGADFTTRDVTGIACSFVGSDEEFCWLLGDVSYTDMLQGFREKYDQADMVTGHYIRNYDLPTLNGAMLEHGLPGLSAKLSSCTKNDLSKLIGVSKSQESLAAMLGIDAPKIQMTQADWRSANRLEPQGLSKTKARVLGDIRQHKAMRKELIRRGLLGPPRMWRPAHA